MRSITGNGAARFQWRRRQPLHFAVRHRAVISYIYYGKIYRVRSRQTFLSFFALVWRHRTYRVGVADISLLRGSYGCLWHYHICAKCCAEWLLFCSCGAYRGAAARCPRKNIASGAARRFLAYRLLPCRGGHIRGGAPRAPGAAPRCRLALRCLAICLFMCYNEAKRRRRRSAPRGGAICIVIIA